MVKVRRFRRSFAPCLGRSKGAVTAHHDQSLWFHGQKESYPKWGGQKDWFQEKKGKSKMGQTWNPSFWTPSFSRNGARRLRNDPGFRSTSPFSPGHTQNDHPAGDRLNSSCIAKKRHVCWSKHDKIIQNIGSFFCPLSLCYGGTSKTGIQVNWSWTIPFPWPQAAQQCQGGIGDPNIAGAKCWGDIRWGKLPKLTCLFGMGKRGKRADFVKTPVLFFLLMDVHGVVLVCGFNLVW